MDKISGQWLGRYSGTNIGHIIPNQGHLEGRLIEGGKINGKWVTNLNTNGTFEVKLREADQQSSCPCEQMTWEKFKEAVSMLDKSKFIFRGQSKAWCLRTLYHRTGSLCVQ